MLIFATGCLVFKIKSTFNLITETILKETIVSNYVHLKLYHEKSAHISCDTNATDATYVFVKVRRSVL